MASSGTLPPLPPTQKKAFIAYLDTHLGAHLATRLLAQDYDVTGMIKDPSLASLSPAIASKVRRVIRRGDVEAIRKALLESDYIVYHTLSSAEDAVGAIRVLTNNHYETEKRFVLISSIMSWFETPSLADPTPAGEDPADVEPLTEDQYNRRVPHVKYLAWRDVEKLCASAQTERLKTFVVFPGLMYGLGEDLLHPLFKQAWTLAPEGLPIYGNGQQLVPMVHTADLITFVTKLFAVTAEDIPNSIRYVFAVDEGAHSWKDIVTKLNAALGNGRVFRVPHAELGLHDNVEHFIVDLKLEASCMKQLLAEDSDWVAKTGFVENIELVCQEYRQSRNIMPLRITVLGPPSVGKSYAAREIAQQFKLPHLAIADVIADYKFQEIELQEEIARIKQAKADARRQEKVDEKRSVILQDRKSARAEAAQAAAAAGSDDPTGGLNPDDADDFEDEDDIEVVLTPDEEKELAEAGADDDNDEAIVLINEKLSEVKRVLSMKVKPIGEVNIEVPNPKDKKAKPAPKPAAGGKGGKGQEAEAKPVDEQALRDANRLSDRALAFMLRWKLSRVECKNQGYVLDGFPKTVRQARLVFEDVEQLVPEDPDEPDLPLDKEEKPVHDGLFPDIVFQCRASDTFLLERLQKTQHEHPHNTPEDFQRRLELFKQHFDVPLGVMQYFESARTTTGRSAVVRTADLEAAPLVPPPPPKSSHAPHVVDPTVLKLFEVIGKPRNFGPSPGDAFAEAERARLLAAEAKAEQAAQAKLRQDRDQADVAQAEASKAELVNRVASMKEAERQMLEQRKGPLKAYLMANVIPILTKGLIEVCNRRPDDPVDFLAEWLFKHNPEDHPEMYA